MNKRKRKYEYVARIVHFSGRFDRSDKIFLRTQKWLEESFAGTSIYTGTEAASRGNEDFPLADEKWGMVRYHKGSKGNRKELWLRYRKAVWALHSFTQPQISAMSFHRVGGAEVEDQFTLRVVLKHRDSGDLFIFYVVHMSLDNTPLRAEVWKDSCGGLYSVIKQDKIDFPNCKQVIQGDVNKNWREEEDRVQCRVRLEEPNNMTCAWDGNVPMTGGTHGPLGIIDHTYVSRTRLHVRSCKLMTLTRLLRRVSDHHPYKVIVVWN
jgi:endonuclease/exonuclease/phosphatase family metal-dependent hydrolase